jgi:hypothetical protein
MDGDRFDQFARTLARTASRRSVVRGLSTLLVGTTVAGRPLSARGAPHPCNVYCAGEAGPRGAQCRQACKACGGPTSPGFCYDEAARSFTCCPEGLGCFDVGQSVICCASSNQVCYGNEGGDGAFCCADGSHCAYPNLCCPEEVGACFDTHAQEYVCGQACWNVCLNREICGERAENGACIGVLCFDPCSQSYRCGNADETGQCDDVPLCHNLCDGSTYCLNPNGNGNCEDFTCSDLCRQGADACGDKDENGACILTSCTDPASGERICGDSCVDICNGVERCGPRLPGGYCGDTACTDGSGYLQCGTPDDDGACFEQAP